MSQVFKVPLSIFKGNGFELLFNRLKKRRRNKKYIKIKKKNTLDKGWKSSIKVRKKME